MRDKRLGKVVRDALRDSGFILVERPRLLHLPPMQGERIELYGYEGLCDTKFIQVKERVLQITRDDQRDLFLKWMRRQYAQQITDILFDD